MISLALKAIRALSSSLTSRNSITPFIRRSSKVNYPLAIPATIDYVSKMRPLSRIRSGRTSLPESVLIMISPYCSFFRFTMDMLRNFSMRPLRRSSRTRFTSVSLWVYPTTVPSTSTRCPLPWAMLLSMMPKLWCRNCLQEVVMHVVSARFFTSPQPSPSGVSQGHIIPQCEPSRARGPAIFRVF